MSSKPKAWLSEHAAEEIRTRAAASHPCETGGILAGVRVGSRPWVTHAIEIRWQQSSRSRYAIPEGATRRAIEDIRASDKRIGYLGDWHSHPADFGPSSRDAVRMMRTAGDPRATCRHPLLLIALRTVDGYELDVTEWSLNGFRGTRLIMAGGLKPISDSRGKHIPNPADSSS